MTRRSKPSENLERLRLDAVELLENFQYKLENADLRDQVIALVPVVYKIRDMGASLIAPKSSMSARERIISYLKRYPYQIVEGDELLVVSGIGEWARRLRELRTNFGWSIYSGTTFKDIQADPEQEAEIQAIKGSLHINIEEIRPDQYVLVSTVQDLEAAHRWNTLNDLRKTKLSVQDKILEYLRINVGKPVSGEELKYLAKDRSEWARRARELRTDHGWPVKTKSSGRPDLPIAYYVLEQDRQAPTHDRVIPDDVRVTVLERDQFRCIKPGCGWGYKDAKPGDRRTMLELHHVHHYANGGDNAVNNLVTLCNVHHDEIHRKNSPEQPPGWMVKATN